MEISTRDPKPTVQVPDSRICETPVSRKRFRLSNNPLIAQPCNRQHRQDVFQSSELVSLSLFLTFINGTLSVTPVVFFIACEVDDDRVEY